MFRKLRFSQFSGEDWYWQSGGKKEEAASCKMTWISDGDIWPPLFVYCFCFTKLMLKDLNFDKSPVPNLDIPFKQKLKYLGKTGFEKQFP